MFSREFEFDGISKKEFPFIYEKIFYFKKLLSLPNVVYEVRNGIVYLVINGLKFTIKTKEEIFILSEIFVDDSYKLFSSRPYIFIDVGLNAGFTTLYFANDPSMIKAYGFELFSDTLNQAKVNIGLNPRLAEKIETFVLGLGKEDKRVELEYSYKFKGNVGVHGITKHLISNGLADDIERKEVTIRRSSDVLSPIIKRHPDESIVLKLDCEGSEYDILDELSSSFVLKEIDILLIEWHFQGYEKLVKVLLKNGFGSIVHGKNTDDVGILTAFNQKNNGT
ncbi:MAG: FkbM family methyltransferase [Flavobacteriaceae bacterium]|nr:FkbM family methyltransferase [Flavobacteriaceae bacterium]